MSKNRSEFNKPREFSPRRNARFWRVIVAAVCLITVGVGVTLLAGRNSRAAAPSQQEGKVSSKDGIWEEIAEDSITTKAEREIVPQAYRTVRLNMNALRGLLEKAPMEFTAAAQAAPVEMTLPLPDGKFARFRVVESPMMEPGLAAKHPEIKTYSGRGIDDPMATTRFGLTPLGFHAIILSAGDTIYIDPYAKNDALNYISYFKRHYPRGADEAFHCLVSDSVAARPQSARVQPNNVVLGSYGWIRFYRLAMAATG